MIRWCAIGDSFTYLNDHPDETNHYVTKGYLSRTLDSLRAHGLDAELTNIGIKGSTTRDWLTAPLVPADFYTILLGTNDWHSGIPLGTEEDFSAARPGTILGNLSHLIGRIRALSPEAKLLVMNPIERTDFVYLFDPFNNAPGSSPMWRRRFTSPARVIKSRRWICTSSAASRRKTRCASSACAHPKASATCRGRNMSACRLIR